MSLLRLRRYLYVTYLRSIFAPSKSGNSKEGKTGRCMRYEGAMEQRFEGRRGTGGSWKCVVKAR